RPAAPEGNHHRDREAPRQRRLRCHHLPVPRRHGLRPVDEERQQDDHLADHLLELLGMGSCLTLITDDSSSRCSLQRRRRAPGRATSLLQGPRPREPNCLDNCAKVRGRCQAVTAMVCSRRYSGAESSSAWTTTPVAAHPCPPLSSPPSTP